ncbi:hypothetical protein [Devosia sp. CN2-171]|uniref:hypothetical protein n=1 Tax=Devosia sp. CN2-171 TaxID=3400909 RepID=UPI003BF7CA7B
MVKRPEIELRRERGDWVEVPKGPLDKPRTLWLLMVLFGGMTLLCVVMAYITGNPMFALLTAPFAFLAGVAFVGRFPAMFFRRDRT